MTQIRISDWERILLLSEQQIISVLRKHDIPYWTEGKNVSKNAISIKCPFCEDQSNHCGIFKKTLVYYCWRCSARGSLAYLLQKLTGIDSQTCQEEIDQGSKNFRETSLNQIHKLINPEEKIEKEINRTPEVQLPKCVESITPALNLPLLNFWMKRRRISIDTIMMYGGLFCGAGDYMNRLIIPIYFQGKLVSFQSADLTARAFLKYETAPGNINNYLYNYDNSSNRIFLTEGILDAWRIGSDAMASFGTHITLKQRALILKRRPKELVFCWDSDAYLKAKKAAREFEPFCEIVRVVHFPYGEDPDSYGRNYGIEKLYKLIEGV